MSHERDRRREELLDELRRSHRAEPAPDGLRQRLIEQAGRRPLGLGSAQRMLRPARLDATAGRLATLMARHGSRAASLDELGRPRVLPGALTLLGGAVALLLGVAVALRVTGGTGDETFTAGEGDAASPLALGPEPRSSASRSSPAGQPAPVHAPGDDRAGLDRAQGPRTCPLAQVPRYAVLMPRKGGAPGLTVHTFEQQTFTCGPLTRRYLMQLPPGHQARSNAPVLIVLHDAGESAETMLARRDRLDFSGIAREKGAIVIYANAAPGSATSVGVADSGAWQTDPRTHQEVDDADYLSGILTDLGVQHVIDGHNDVFLVGYGDGAAMALDAAARRPGYVGVAAFAPTNLALVAPDLRVGSRLSRVMLVYRLPRLIQEPARSGDAWSASMPMVARRWGTALGVEQKVIARSWKFGAPQQPLGSLEQYDVALPATGSAAVRVYVLDGAVERAPGALHAWDFLTGVEGADPEVPDSLPDLPVEPLFADGESVLPSDADGYEYPSLVLPQDVVPAPPRGADDGHEGRPAPAAEPAVSP